MLSLDSEDWKSLQHAYGPSLDTPSLIRQIAANPRPKTSFQAEPWFSLWSSLCHQGDVYTASYAAVPHVVQIALRAEGPIDSSFLQLPACIEVARICGRGPIVPPKLADSYLDAIRRLSECVCAHMNDPWDAGTTLIAAAAFAVAKGHAVVGQALLNLDQNIIRKINNFEL